MRPQKSYSNGFTLIEIAIAMIIVGLLMVPTLQIYNNYQKQKKMVDTEQNIQIVQAALGKFVDRNGFYPAPSQPNIPINQTGSGQAAVLPVTTVCAVNSTVVCRTDAGSIDTLADVDAAPDFVLIGTIPYATLGIPYQTTIDGYGYQLKYAVTESMTAQATFGNNFGVIQVLNDGRAPATPSVYNAGAPRGHYIVASLGPDARGAFNLNGTMTANCGTAADGLDFENCDNDAVFRNNIFQFEDSPDTTPDVDPSTEIQVNTPAGTLHFDDYLIETNSTASGLWAFVPNQSIINSTQSGNVEVGVDPACVNASCRPRVRMNVNGNVLVEQELKTSRLCNVNDNDCLNTTGPGDIPYQWFTPVTIAGTPGALPESHTSWDSARQGHRGSGILCVGDRGLRGINNFDEQCEATVRISNPGIVGAGCDPTATGLFPVGLTATGQIICE